MSLPRVLILLTIVIFGSVFALSYFKDGKKKAQPEMVSFDNSSVELNLDFTEEEDLDNNDDVLDEDPGIEWTFSEPSTPAPQQAHSFSEEILIQRRQETVSNIDRINEFFNKGKQKLPIVETITYSSRTPWLKGRAAWLADYASHYKTSRHFIARSLHGRPDYDKQNLAEGDRFNVFKPDAHIEFHLIIDAQLCKMWFYYVDLDSKERTLLKVYNVGLGHLDDTKESGLATPLGTYSLGDQIAVFRPGKKGLHNKETVEMVRVLGTRWIPFDQEISGCTEPAKGYGIHGVPWHEVQGELKEDCKGIGRYESAGCVRLATADMEELFAIVITKPTTLQIVKNIKEAQLPGMEK